MNPTAIYSKTGKGVQEASGKTSQLSRGDRSILSAIDGKITLKDLGAKFDRPADDKFFALIRKMDADGFIREVSPGTVQRGAANAPRPAAKAPAGGGGGGGEELDFTQIFSAPPRLEKPPAPSAPAGKDPMVAAREAAEARARAEREARTKADTAAKAISEATQKERLDVEARAKASREAVMAAAAEGKTTAQIEAEKRAAEEAKARAERQAKERAERELREKAEAAERSRFESAERARREAEDLRRKVEEERRAREEAERRAREEADELRRKLEEERKAREAAERKAQEERDKRESVRLAELKKIQEEEEATRKAREEQDRREEAENQRQIRLAREAEDKKRRDADARKKKEQEAKRWEQEEARRKSDDAYRQRAEIEDKERAAREEVEAVERVEAEKKSAEAADALAGSLLADLDSFSARQDEEKKEKEEAEQKARAEAEKRARHEAEQREREEAERKQRKEEERRRKEEEERREKEEERREKEGEEKKKEEAERKKREREEQARQKAAPAGEVPISNADMDRGAVSDDERKLSPEARKALRDREREVARARNRGDDVSSRAAAAYKRKQPVKWGKPVAIALFFLLVGGVGVVNFMPLSTTEYEKLASDAVGAPVKIGAARMWVLAGVQMRFERVSIGDAVKIAEVRAIPEIDTLLGEDKVFSRLEMDGVVLQQDALADVLQGGMKGRRLRVARLVAKEARLEGPLPLPTMDVDASIGGDGKVGSVKLSGERINGLLTPKGAEIAFDLSLGSFAVPFFGTKLSLADFGMKGVANRQGMAVNEFTGRLYDGTVAGTARIQWGAQWSVQGQVEGRSMNAAVFSPQLVSEGRFDGKGRYTMGGPDPLKLYEAVRLDGGFTVAKGALGSFDLARALQSSSAQASGRTPFTELEGKVALAAGALTLRDLELSSGLLKATGSLDIDAKGALAGRINAELRTLRGQLYIGGSLTDPQLRR